jgi:hypothetical protein
VSERARGGQQYYLRIDALLLGWLVVALVGPLGEGAIIQAVLVRFGVIERIVARLDFVEVVFPGRVSRIHGFIASAPAVRPLRRGSDWTWLRVAMSRHTMRSRY